MSDQILVKFKKGSVAEIPSEINEGTLYVTTDEKGLYLDVTNTERIRINEPMQSDLSQTDAAAADYVKGIIRKESLPEGYPYQDGITIEWDGNTDGLHSENGLYLISEAIITNDEFKNGYVTESPSGSTLSIAEYWSVIERQGIVSEDYLVFPQGMLVLIRKPNTVITEVNNSTFEKAGVYVSVSSTYISKISTGFTVKMSQEFLPDCAVQSTGNNTKIFNVLFNRSDNSVDKTFNEIKIANKKGEVVIATDPSNYWGYYSLSKLSDKFALFTRMEAAPFSMVFSSSTDEEAVSGTSSSAAIAYESFAVKDDDTVEFYSGSFDFDDISTKQDALTFDTIPTEGSTNPVTSEGIKAYVDEQVTNSSTAQVQSDLSQTDDTAADYVKGVIRKESLPEGYPYKSEEAILDGTFEFADGGGIYMHQIADENFVYVDGESYTVIWDGEAYQCIATTFSNILVLGNLGISGMTDTGEPFLFLDYGNGQKIIATKDTSATHNVTVCVETIHPIAQEFLPEIAIENGMVLKNIQAVMPSSEGWLSVAYGNGKFVAMSKNSTQAAYSEDGINWTVTTSPSSDFWDSVTYGNGKFVAVAYRSKGAAYSEDGINWTKTTMPISADWTSVTYANGKFVAVAENTSTAAYSEDGITWTAVLMPRNDRWYSVTYGNGKFVTVIIASDKAAYSEDGINWTISSMPSIGNWSSVTYGNGKFVAVESTDAAYSKAAYSEDGINWTETTMPSSDVWDSVTYGNGKFVAVASVFDDSTTSGSTIAAYSEDGITWVATTMPSSARWTSITYGNGKFVAIAFESDKSAYSEDGITWHDSFTYISQDGEDVTDDTLIALDHTHDEYATKTELDDKQGKLTFDSLPTSGSSNPVTSEGIKTYVDNAVVQPDWSQNDETAPDYVKNRTHYEKPVEVFNVENAEFTNGQYINETPFVITDGNTYIVNWDGTDYTCVAYIFAGLPVIGNTSEFGGKGNNEPFYIVYVSAENINPIITFDDLTTHTVSVVENVVNTIDHKYIKDMYYDNGVTSTVLVDNQTVTGFAVLQDPIYAVRNPFSLNLVKGNTYIVNWDGTEYELVANGASLIYVGNQNYVSMTSGGDIPFAIICQDSMLALATESTEESHTISVTEVVRNMKQLDEKYLSILEETNKVVFSMDDVVGEYEFAEGMLLGTYKVTVDGVSEYLEFLDNSNFSRAQSGTFYIETWNFGIYFEFYDGNVHSVKIEKVQNVVKKEYLPQADWNQNDETAPDYVKNRPFYIKDPVDVYIMEEQLITATSAEGYAFAAADVSSVTNVNGESIRRLLEVGQTYIINFNGIDYECVYHANDSLGYVMGNVTIAGLEAEEGFQNNESFLFVASGSLFLLYTKDAGTHAISIKRIDIEIVKIPSKFIDEINSNLVNGDGEGSLKMPMCEAKGPYSFAIGEGTTASTSWSYAEGYGTTASIRYAHAEGYKTTASGDSASHAEGYNTTASGQSSHAEGNSTTASEYASHAEGYRTIAASSYQHAQGKYNIEDSASAYSHIVGNGTSNSKRSNAHTLDWNGTAWFAGDVYVGSTSGTNKDEGSVKLMKEITGTQDQVIGFDANGNAVATNVRYRFSGLTNFDLFDALTFNDNIALSNEENFAKLIESITSEWFLYSTVMAIGDENNMQSQFILRLNSYGVNMSDYAVTLYFVGTYEGANIEASLVFSGIDGTYVSSTISRTPMSSMPSVTTSDNGKFLRVVDGAWAAESFTVTDDGAGNVVIS